MANLTLRDAADTRAYFVLQIELDLLVPAARPDTGDDGDAPPVSAPQPASPSASGAAQHAPAQGGQLRGNLRILGGVNEEAITRLWLARRDARGGFVTCDAPTGAVGD